MNDLTKTDWDDECDVLVIGSGGGGLTGAYTAAREGLRVILAEASDRFGGTTAYSGGGMWFPCNAVLERTGSTDTFRDAATYYHSIVGDRTPRELQDAYLETGARLVDYLEQDDDIEFMVFPWPDYFGSAPKASATGRHIMMTSLHPDELGTIRDSMRSTLPVERAGHPLPDSIDGGQALVGRLLLALSRRDGVDLRLEAGCDELVREGGTRRWIRARRGVLVASGGFEHDDDMRRQHGVPGASRDAMGPATNRGLAIRAAIAVGADTDLMQEAWWSPGLTHPDGSSTFSLWFTGGIFVDDNGERFVNESWAYDRIGREVIDRIAAGEVTLPFWMVYDDRDGDRPPVRATSVPVGETDDYRKAGLWHTADTVEELAEKIGVPAERLAATVTRFNALIEGGHDDDFNRGDEAYDRSFSGGESPLVPIDKGPFHAAAFGISDLGTKGGLRTDASARVLEADGSVIPGLYAAGNSMAAPSGTVYPGGGNPVGTSMVFSHLAVLDMATRAGEEA
jgi:hypothetical protein